LKEIKRHLPFSLTTNPDQATHITDLANQMINLGFQFLNHRNPIIHNIGDPRRKLEDIINLCDEANATYRKFRVAQIAFFEAAAPFRFE
jgi:hypothetical protein